MTREYYQIPRALPFWYSPAEPAMRLDIEAAAGNGGGPGRPEETRP